MTDAELDELFRRNAVQAAFHAGALAALFAAAEGCRTPADIAAAWRLVRVTRSSADAVSEPQAPL